MACRRKANARKLQKASAATENSMGRLIEAMGLIARFDRG
jgi:hypothetical protein